MTETNPRGNAYLHALRDGEGVIATADRERRTTIVRPTVVAPLRWSVALTAAILIAGCGGGKRSDTYARGTQVQEQCCENLSGADRDTCLAEVVRVDDPAAAKTATNQQTYACIVDHFVCDPQTGRETQASAQAQHDCTDDLR